MHDLPIDELLPDIIASLRGRGTVVVEAAPGAGKTTRLPLALLRAGFAATGEIVVLEPRRIAARLAAHFVSELLGEEVGEGEVVGHRVLVARRDEGRHLG